MGILMLRQGANYQCMTLVVRIGTEKETKDITKLKTINLYIILATNVKKNIYQNDLPFNAGTVWYGLTH
jgi:hypothetical protein